MPELPECEAARRLCALHAKGKRILTATAADDTIVIAGVSGKELEEALKGRLLVDVVSVQWRVAVGFSASIVDVVKLVSFHGNVMPRLNELKRLQVHRKGKHVWWELDQRPWPAFHFGMTGSFVVKDQPGTKYKSFKVDSSKWPPKYHKLLLEFEDGTHLAFRDSRRFARIRVFQDPANEPPISELGFDPILSMPQLEEFAVAVRRRTPPIKALLLDQKFAAGVGNWVADEVLYQSRIHPAQRANTLDDDQMKRLHETISHVCEMAVEFNADSKLFPDTWLFHNRWGKKKGKHNGMHIEFAEVGGRTTAIVPAVQKLPKGAAAKTTAATTTRKKKATKEVVVSSASEQGEDDDGDGSEIMAETGKQGGIKQASRPSIDKGDKVVMKPKAKRRLATAFVEEVVDKKQTRTKKRKQAVDDVTNSVVLTTTAAQKRVTRSVAKAQRQVVTATTKASEVKIKLKAKRVRRTTR
eukprot:jgi/Chlat1/1739/Chrsp13S02158